MRVDKSSGAPTGPRLNRRTLLERGLRLGTALAGVSLAAACAPSAPASPAAVSKPAEAPKPAEASKPVETAKPAAPSGQAGASVPAASPAAAASPAVVSGASSGAVAVKMTAANNMNAVPYYVGVEKGIWLKHGVDVKLTTFGSGPELAKALQVKEVDFGHQSHANILVAVEQGLPFVVLAMSLGDQTKRYSDSQLTIVAAKDSGIKAVPDLVGKKVGLVTVGTADEYLRAVLAKNGISADKVEMLNVPAGNTTQALQTGQVQAVVNWEPFGTMALNQVPGSYLVQRGGNYITYSAFFVTRPDVIAERPDVVQKIIDGWVEACWWTRKNPDESALVAIRWVPGLDSETAKRVMQYIPFDPRVTRLAFEALDDTKKQLLEQKKLKGDVNLEKFTNLDFLKKTMDQHPEWLADLPPVS